MSDKFDWFSQLELKGISVLVTRPKKTAGELSNMLKELGANAIEYPCIKTVPLDFELADENSTHVIFTSAVGVGEYFDKLYSLGLDARVLAGKKIAAVGTQTGAELLRHGIKADFVPGVFDGVHLANELIARGKIQKGDRAVLYRAKIGTQEISEILTKNGVEVLDIPVYETVYIEHEGEAPAFDYAAFTSASTVHGFANSFKNKINYSEITAVCIGEQTANAAEFYGMNTAVSDTATVSSMVEKIKELALKNRLNKG